MFTVQPLQAVAQLVATQSHPAATYTVTRVAKSYNHSLHQRAAAKRDSFRLVFYGGSPEELTNVSRAGRFAARFDGAFVVGGLDVAERHRHIHIAERVQERGDGDGKQAVGSNVAPPHAWRALVVLACVGNASPVVLQASTLTSTPASSATLANNTAGAAQLLTQHRYANAQVAHALGSVRSQGVTAVELQGAAMPGAAPSAGSGDSGSDAGASTVYGVSGDEAWRVVPCYLVEYRLTSRQ